MPAAPDAVKTDTTVRYHERRPGFAAGAEITLKGAVASAEQKSNISRVLDVGIGRGYTAAGATIGRLKLVAAVMVITVEPLPPATNIKFGDADSLGLFQQRPSQGWGTADEILDVEHAATSFFEHADAYMQEHPTASAEQLAQGVQGSAHPERYGQWRVEAEHTVNVYFGLDDSTAPSTGDVYDPTRDGNLGFFVRGLIRTRNGHKIRIRESDWACLQRLAQEVGWRCFCVSGTVYFVSDGHLFQSAPRMTISEETDGVDTIDYEWDTGKRNATVTVECRIGRWQAPPGSVVVIEKSGPLNGRWLVTNIRRPLFSADGTITLAKPQPVISEELSPEFNEGDADTLNVSGSGTDRDSASGQAFRVATALVNPIPAGYGSNGSHGAVHPTMGLDNYPALDFFAKPGTPVVAPENGTIERFSGHDPSLGAIDGAGGPLGWSIYMRGASGTDYYLTHLDDRTCVEGQKVLAGQQIATVADYDRFGRRSHTHVGVHGGPVTIDDLGNAPQAVKG